MALLVASSASAGTAAAARPAMKVFLSEPGLYRVGFEELAAAGWPAEPLASSRLVLRQGDRELPIRVEDGGDGRFDAGDAVLFAGDRLAGEHGYYNEYSSLNVYWLSESAEATPAARLAERSAKTGQVAAPSGWQRRIRMEEDRLLLRYPNAGVEDQELWFWQKLSYLDTDRFEVPIDLGDLDSRAGATGGAEGGGSLAPTIDLTIELRGWSKPNAKPSPEFPDHAVEVLWDGAVVGRREWQGTAAAERIELRLPVSDVAPGVHRLGLRVPERPAIKDLPLVDVSILNWLEVVAPRTAKVGARSGASESAGNQVRIEPRPASDGRAAQIEVAPGARIQLFTDAGEHFAIESKAGAPTRAGIPSAGAMWAVANGAYLAPRSLELDRPSAWKRPDHQADYLLVVHPKLAAATAPLVALRRSQGLSVAEVDIRDIYDEWSGGVTDPRAVRDFVDYAFHHWQSPAPRFLLLVGDASWDGKNDRPVGASPDWTFRLSDRAEFIQNGSTPYTSSELAASRNLIPTWGYGSAEGHAAGDNAFVAVDGDDELPDLAVGRFPVIEPREVEAIVAKIVAYERSPEPGDWQSRILWITNEEDYTQKSSDKLAEEMAARGYSSRKIYPEPVIPPTSDDQVALRGAFDEGALVVHFFGHGGRYIWRTAAPDLASQRDLFDLADVEALQPTDRLPFVLSMTCYSAPFDHPTADSIGEKLLREPGKGAIAVFAASWRNSPREEWSRAILEELARPGTIGESLLKVKRALQAQDLVEQYNLLGDPATRLALPSAAAAAPGGHAASVAP